MHAPVLPPPSVLFKQFKIRVVDIAYDVRFASREILRAWAATDTSPRSRGYRRVGFLLGWAPAVVILVSYVLKWAL